MSTLNIEAVGTRAAMTIMTTSAWLVLTFAVNGHLKSAWALGIGTFFIVIPVSCQIGSWLDQKLPGPGSHNVSACRQFVTTMLEFLLYATFITLVTYQSVQLGKINPFWYVIPTGLTIGIVPQIANSLYRLYSIVISALVYAVILFYCSDIHHFIDKDIHFHYLLVGITAFSVVVASSVVSIVIKVFEILRVIFNWIISLFEKFVNAMRRRMR